MISMLLSTLLSWSQPHVVRKFSSEIDQAYSKMLKGGSLVCRDLPNGSPSGWLKMMFVPSVTADEQLVVQEVCSNSSQKTTAMRRRPSEGEFIGFRGVRLPVGKSLFPRR